jgi:hypothetical protein
MIPMRKPIRILTAIIAAIGTTAFTVLGVAGAASAASAGPPARHHHGSCIGVQEKTSGAFSNNQDVLQGRIVPGSVAVVATQGASGDNPPVTTFGLGTGYTVSPDWHVVTLQAPYAGSNDGFTTYYAVFRSTCSLPRGYSLQTKTSGAFSNNQDVLAANNIVPGSVFVVATLGMVPGGDNPSVNGFNLNGYTVAYSPGGATATLLSPYAGSNDGFTTYYTVLFR